MDYRIEELGGGVMLCVSDTHTFGTDALMLSHFAAPKNRETVCDLCAGCGAVAFLWYRNSAQPRHVYAVDIQEEAVKLMEKTAGLSGISGFTPILGDLREPEKLLPAGSLDLITCNPPYRAAGSGIQSAEPSARTARHELFCTLDDVFASAKRLLRFGGRICVCHLPERLSDVLSSMRAHSFEPKRLRLCQESEGKPPWLILAEGKLGARPGGLVIEPVFLLKQNGALTQEAEKIYGKYRK